MLLQFSSVEQLTSQASRLMENNEFQFSDFCSLFGQFKHEDAGRFINSILFEILNQKTANKKPAYSEQIHLSSQDDFNLSLKIVGEGTQEENSTLCANDFELIVVSLAKKALSVPVYQTGIKPESVYDRPEPLLPVIQLTMEPCRPYLFEAFTEIVDLEFAERQEPVLIIHSKPRAPVTWVFDRNTGEPQNLTDNDLQRSRIQLAVRVIGETGQPEHAKVLSDLARSDYNHVVRWEAAESLYKLNEKLGLSLLQDHLVHDRCQDLSNAARQTLKNLEEESVS